MNYSPTGIFNIFYTKADGNLRRVNTRIPATLFGPKRTAVTVICTKNSFPGMFCVIFRDSSTTSQYGFLSRQKKCVFHLKNIFKLLSVSIKKLTVHTGFISNKAILCRLSSILLNCKSSQHSAHVYNSLPILFSRIHSKSQLCKYNMGGWTP